MRLCIEVVIKILKRTKCVSQGESMKSDMQII